MDVGPTLLLESPDMLAAEAPVCKELPADEVLPAQSKAAVASVARPLVAVDKIPSLESAMKALEEDAQVDGSQDLGFRRSQLTMRQTEKEMVENQKAEAKAAKEAAPAKAAKAKGRPRKTEAASAPPAKRSKVSKVAAVAEKVEEAKVTPEVSAEAVAGPAKRVRGKQQADEVQSAAPLVEAEAVKGGRPGNRRRPRVRDDGRDAGRVPDESQIPEFLEVMSRFAKKKYDKTGETMHSEQLK